MSAEPKTHDLTVVRIFNTPVEQVWRAWSDSELVKRWWGPTDFTAPIADMDFREGGTSLVCMRAPREFGGQDFYNTWTYRKITPLQQIDFVQHFSDKDGQQISPASAGLPPDIPLEVPHRITFKALPDGKTQMSVTEFGYTSEQTVEMSRMGLEQCLDKMEMALQELSSNR